MQIHELHKLFLSSKGVTTDTRKIEKGQIFFALKGENFNGNQFALQAIENGAIYAIVDEEMPVKSNRIILVNDVLACLQDLARYHRNFLGIPVIAITGTNGKTTSKELIKSVLQTNFRVQYTRGNLNNHIGVPLTLLSFDENTEIGVVEMGANHIGEISKLCQIACPDYGVITNIGKAHLEGFGSYEGVIEAKSELYHYLKLNEKVVFVNGNDDLLLKLSSEINRFLYGTNPSFYVYGSFLDASPFLSILYNGINISTRLVGAYNINNVLLAICIGKYFKISDLKIAEAISSYMPENNRSQLISTKRNTLIVDAYNANPSSMEVSILNFLNIKSDNKFMILGDMFELGANSKEEHWKITELIHNCQFREVYFVGSHFFELKENYCDFVFFENIDFLIDLLKENLISGKTILLKASRGIKLEKIIPYL
ncbi:MAG: UDP-N-acetylmuramoyl-tripeptide--D-alanyl-D-alanine ligase [Bacteroidales bacterium]